MDSSFGASCKEDEPLDCKARCERGNGKACFVLAGAIRDSKAPRDQYGMVIDRLKQAANHGVPEAYLELARIYAVGMPDGPARAAEDVSVDLDLATSFARMGCDRGLGASCYQEGLLLEDGATPDLPRARIAFSRASERGEAMGYAAVARMDAESKTSITQPPIQCPDSVAGTWFSQVFTSRNQWYEFRLYVRRQGTDKVLFGEIWVDYWSGAVVLAANKKHAVMGASGEATLARKQSVRFDGASIRSATSADYQLDRFRGDLDGNLFLADDEDGTNMRFYGIGRIAFVRVGCDSKPPTDSSTAMR